MIRTEEEIERMIRAIEAQIKSLPPTNLFGDSNEASIAEMEKDLQALQAAQSGNQIDNDEVEAWLNGNTFSSLEDYLI